MTVLLCAGLAAFAARADDSPLSGAAKVRGPDMLVLSGTRIRFSGVLPPADDSRCADGPCVELATTALSELTGRGPVTCIKERRLGHGYFLGHCTTSDGSDPALALLELGLLLVDPANAPESYARAADAARAAGAGIWGS